MINLLLKDYIYYSLALGRGLSVGRRAGLLVLFVVVHPGLEASLSFFFPAWAGGPGLAWGSAYFIGSRLGRGPGLRLACCSGPDVSGLAPGPAFRWGSAWAGVGSWRAPGLDCSELNG